MKDTPENYYTILGVPLDANNDTIKRAYRQLARRFHPDLAGEQGAIEMKRINRAYAVLSDAKKRHSYDTLLGGVVDLRRRGAARPRPQRPTAGGDGEFSGLTTFSTRGPLQAGPVIRSQLGVISALTSIRTVQGLLIAAGSLDGKGMLWQVVKDSVSAATGFASDPALTVESLRELRLSPAGSLLTGWGRLGLHVWDALNGARLWSYSLLDRAVSAHYSLDAAPYILADGKQRVRMALPHLAEDVRAPRARGVRGTDIISHDMGTTPESLFDPLLCTEAGMENRQFWAIRMRVLAQDARTLVTLSCAQIPQEQQQMTILRRWDLAAKGRLGGKTHTQITTSILVGQCADCAPPYAATADARLLAFVNAGTSIHLYDTFSGTYSEIPSGTMGSSSRLAISPDAQWLAIAREDSEINEGIIDLWSITTGQIVQKFYHPWQISALHFADKQLVVALTDGTIQLWR